MITSKLATVLELLKTLPVDRQEAIAASLLRDFGNGRGGEVLLTREDLLLEMFNSTDDSAILTDTAGTILLHNDCVAVRVGRPGEDLRGLNIYELVPEVIATQGRELLAKVLETGDFASREDQLGDFTFRVDYHPIRDKDGRIVRIAAYSRDTTQHKAAEDALREERTRFEFVIKGSKQGCWEWNVQTNQTVFNEIWAEMIGYTLEELTPYSYTTWQQLVHPDDIKRAEQALADCIEQRTDLYECEFRMRHKQGHWIWILDRGQVMTRDREGKPLSMFGTHLDITERKQAEHAMREREAYLSTILETAADGFMMIDLEGRIRTTNQTLATMTGFSKEQLTGMNISELDAIETEEESQRHMRRLLKLGREVFETRFRTGDGGTMPVEISAAYVERKGGEFICFCRDLTERKRVEQAFQESHALLENLARLVPGVIYQYQLFPDGRSCFPYASPGIRGIYEVTPEQVQKDASDVFDRLHPEDRQRVTEDIFESARTLATFNCEFRVILPQQGLRWRLSVAHPQSLEDGSILWHGVITDVTERKKAEEALRESEQKFRELLHNVPAVAVQGFRPDKTVFYWNEGSRRLYGYEEEEVLDKVVLDLLVFPEDRADIDAAFREVVSTGIPPTPRELVLMRKDGSPVHVFTSDCVMQREGHPMEIYSVDVDLTELKRADAEREQLRQQLLQSQKLESVGRLAGGVAHDFNNMLNVIMGHVELALDQVPTNSVLHGDLEEVLKAAQRSADLTRQLLAFARKQTVSPKVLNINESVESMLKMLRRLIGEAIELVWKPTFGLEAVRMDPAQVDQVLANLCVNARDAIGSAGGRVTISTSQKEFDDAYVETHDVPAPGRYVCLSIQDTGCGIPAEMIEKIFDPFFTTKGIGEGTGLGLATVYGIVKQNNGFIKVESTPGVGTIFHIHIPGIPAQAEFKPEQEPQPEGGTETILVVEDEPSILMLTVTILQRLGYSVLAAATPAEALRLAQQGPREIDLLLTDVVMPSMNGREIAARILVSHPKIKRLFMSGYTADIIAHQGVLDDGVHFIQKPFTRAELARRVREALDE